MSGTEGASLRARILTSLAEQEKPVTAQVLARAIKEGPFEVLGLLLAMAESGEVHQLDASKEGLACRFLLRPR